MRCLRTLSVLSVTLSLVWSMTIETTSPRLTTKPKNISDNVMQTNASSSMAILDVRTPPKIQNFIKDKLMSSKHAIEQSHAGVAIPLDDEDVLEETTKKMNFYKLDRPTTTSNGGLSTWILLSGQTSPTSTKPTTKKPSVKPIILKDEKNNETLMLSEKPMKIVKPAFKQKSTTQKPSSTTVTAKNVTKKLTKVKASLLQNITKNNDVISTTTTLSTTVKPIPTTSSAHLPAEAKEAEQELPSTTTEKKKKKKKKNKRRKPENKEGNTKLKEVESAGTQLYSYLKSEILPVTVGFSLVGLLVTAGLASYYLQPFAALRRTDPIVDRKDTESNYYYRDEYSNAVPEEEAIGKVIAGMPESTLQQASRNSYPQNVRYRHVDRRSQIYMNPYGSVEDVKLNDDIDNNKQFVVGNVPKEAVTPAVVPEHGPRYLKEGKFVVGNVPKEYMPNGAPRRLKRQVVPDDSENEISNSNEDLFPIKTTTIKNDITELDTTHNVLLNTNERPLSTWFALLTDLFKLKVRLGLELMQNVTNSVSSYVTKVHSRLDEHYRRAFKNSTG